MFFGSLNDEKKSPSQVETNARAAFTAVRDRAPKVPLVVVGPQWMQSNPPADIRTNSAAVHAAADAVNATWVDPLNAGWFDAPLPNSLIGKDGVHPTDAGHAYLAKLMKPIINRAAGVNDD